MSEIFTRIYNAEHAKGFLGIVPKQAKKELIEKFLQEVSAAGFEGGRRLSPTLIGSSHPIVIFTRGIEKQCLYSAKILKLRAIVSLVVINVCDDYEKVLESIFAAQEINESEFYRDSTMMLCRLFRSCVLIGKNKTIVGKAVDIGKLLDENSDIFSQLQDFSITDKCYAINEGEYNC